MGFWNSLGDFLTDHTLPGALIGAGVREGNYWKNLGSSLGKASNWPLAASDTFRFAMDPSGYSDTSSAASTDAIDSDTRDWLSDIVSSGNDARAEQAEVDRAFQQESANSSMQFSHNEAKLQRDWLTKMSNSAYQRASDDMRAAGLNPALMYANGGSGASTPSGSIGSGAQASGSRADVDTSTIAEVTSALISSAAYASNSQLTNMTSMAKTLIPLIASIATGNPAPAVVSGFR